MRRKRREGGIDSHAHCFEENDDKREWIEPDTHFLRLAEQVDGDATVAVLDIVVLVDGLLDVASVTCVPVVSIEHRGHVCV